MLFSWGFEDFSRVDLLGLHTLGSLTTTWDILAHVTIVMGKSISPSFDKANGMSYQAFEPGLFRCLEKERI